MLDRSKGMGLNWSSMMALGVKLMTLPQITLRNLMMDAGWII
jgi:hypothetical protein